MLKTLDILIGSTTVVLIFALAVTVLTQAITNIFARKGEHLRTGLASLLQQIGISEAAIAGRIAGAVLTHPLLSGKGWRGKVHLAAVIHREEFTRLLLDAASGQQPELWPTLDAEAKASLCAMLKENGIADPGAALSKVNLLAMQLEATSPELATDVRQTKAILLAAPSAYVARVNTWFDQTIDRVSQQFAKHTHYVTVALATLVVCSVQLDMIAVINRLSLDDALRHSIVESAVNDPAMKGQNAVPANQGDLQTQKYYDALSETGLVTLPTDASWLHQWNTRKLPGILLAILLVSLGAPFWYNILKDLLGLRSAIAKNDDQQRCIRQTTQSVQPDVAALSVVSSTPSAS